ncbi:hypothetical protein EDB84DRAFT_1261558 [Lactarius hengduanensis]|nr:hypothetical protein EDB84DRAFT_1261558 [Lactarius hengduanensis]
MRQLIPRLLRRLKERSVAGETIRPLRPPAQGARSLRRPLPPPPVFSGSGRSRSILLDEINPIIKPKLYRRHKSLPPQVRLPDSQKARTVSRNGTVEDDVRREMTAEEREWYANPYLRMLSTPIRRCSMSSRYLPSDFMVRLSVKRLPSPRTGSKQSSYVLVPDGLQHPKFKGLDSRKGHYIVCRRAVIKEFDKRKSYRRVLSAIGQFSSLPEYIGHLLRLRILQELELLAARLQARPQCAADSPLLRRLTWKELSAIRAGKPVQDGDAVAILVVPPLNRDPATMKRPLPNASPLPELLAEHPTTTTPKRVPLPLSTMCRALSPEDHQGFPDLVTPMKVPLYNGASLFPSRTQRAALHEWLCKLLMIERRARWRQHGPASTSELDNSRSANRLASPAFLLLSGAGTVLRADTVPLAIALWRLRMWEDDGTWERGEGTWATSHNVYTI